MPELLENAGTIEIEPTAQVVESSRRMLAGLRTRAGARAFAVERGDLPVELNEILFRVVAILANSHRAVVQIAEGEEPAEELTTHEAARLLRISRPTLIRLLDQKQIRYRMAGTHRRVDRASLREYQSSVQHEAQPALTREQRRAAMAELHRVSDEMGLED
jgi:excisionase family DNA binding protein